nr:hypothetical protein [uncultured Massilia sp.]
MNSLAWIGIIFWGLLVTGFGLASVTPAQHVASGDIAAQDVIFLIAGGLLTCLIGAAGLMGFMGWIPGVNGAGLRNEQKNAL